MAGRGSFPFGAKEEGAYQCNAPDVTLAIFGNLSYLDPFCQCIRVIISCVLMWCHHLCIMASMASMSLLCVVVVVGSMMSACGMWCDDVGIAKLGFQTMMFSKLGFNKTPSSLFT